MRFSESWLRSWVNPPLSSEALAHLLTMAGLEVEETAPIVPAFDQVVVGQVLSVERHPDAERLSLLKVDVGQDAPLDIVCGAQNVMVGMKAPCALVGAKLSGIEIKQAQVRGITSFGMMCSAKELGLAEESDGLYELGTEASVGQDIRDHLQLNDQSITLKLTPNRSDCLSLYGIAREVAALTNIPLQVVPATTFKVGGKQSVKVGIEATEACPRYIGRVINGVNVRAATPDWMVRRLQRSGLRSISAIVDVTNYVMLELGQPLHAFDLAKLNGGITVRNARAGEKIKLLNEQTVALEPDMLVIADDKAAVALAGIMGGIDSAVTDATTDIFLESAFFAPNAIAGKSRRLGFSSDSSYRFERGVDFAATQVALDRATQLILDICGGEASTLTEVLGRLPARPSVRLRVQRIQRVLGVALSADEVAQILKCLDMDFQRAGDEFSVIPPSYRFDIAIEEDLIEEVARVYGYERIQPLTPIASMSMLPHSEIRRPLAVVRQLMVLRDYQEAVNYAFVGVEVERDLCGNAQPLKLLNPIASQMSVMRSSLLGGLLGTLRSNLARKQQRVRVFEVGACFSNSEQHERMAGLCYGSAYAEQWGVATRSVDFYDVKADVEAVFAPAALSFVAASHAASHPGRSAQIWLHGKVVGWIGELHPQWQQQYDIAQTVVWFEFDLAALQLVAVPHAVSVSKFPLVRRDLAVIVAEEVAVQSLLQSMLKEKVPYVIELALFDLYRGKGVDEGKKSLAFRVLLQDTEKTLTDVEIDQSVARLLAVLQLHGAQLRM